jgi:predicted type IV restriction endonuclease
MKFPSRIPAKEASHLPVNDAHNLVIVNYTVGISKVVVHEAQVWIVIGVREEGIALQGLDAAVVASVRVGHDLRPDLASIGRLD